MEQTKVISAHLWARRGKVIVTKNLKQWRRSPGWATVLRELNRCVVEYSDDDVIYDEQLYKAVRAYLLSEDFAVTGAPYMVQK